MNYMIKIIIQVAEYSKNRDKIYALYEIARIELTLIRYLICLRDTPHDTSQVDLFYRRINENIFNKE